MDEIALPAEHGMVFPADSMGYTLSDGRMIIAYDYEDSFFHMDDATSCTHGQLSLQEILKRPTTHMEHPPVSKYVSSFVIGDCRVDATSASGVLVRSATRSYAVMPGTLTPISTGCATELCDLRLIIGDRGFVFPRVRTSGGTMALVDSLVSFLARRAGLKTASDVQLYQRNLPTGLLSALRVLRSETHLVLQMVGEFTLDSVVPPAIVTSLANESMHAASRKSVLWHASAMRWLDASPWVLPCTAQDLWRLAGIGHQGVEFDTHQLSAPYTMSGDDIVIGVGPRLYTRTSITVAPDDLIYGIRGGSVLPRAGGRYEMIYNDGTWGEVLCSDDLREIVTQVRRLQDQCLVIGKYDVRAMLPGCPEQLFRDTFGSHYCSTTGIYDTTSMQFT